MRRISVVFATLMFLLNPNLACDDGPQFQYGETEMRAAVVGNWQVALTDPTGTTQLTLRIEQGAGPQASWRPNGLVRSAHACGTRTFVKSAAACMDISEMPLSVTVVGGNGAYANESWSGKFEVMSLVFSQGQLHLTFGNLRLEANLRPDGSVESASLYPASFPAPETMPTVSLARI
jgi:hypothetical protein